MDKTSRNHRWTAERHHFHHRRRRPRWIIGRQLGPKKGNKNVID